MKVESRILVAGASILLILVYFFPIWRISLDAPQYPEGLGMYIEINNVTGVERGNLASINALNHYIGMKEISADTIPELVYMPWIVGFLLASGLAVSLSGRRILLYVWLAAFILVGMAGLVDFYLWGYDYGHNLNHETAIIKVPGMTYQPPLIGVKQLLNIRAASWPWIGGWAAIASMGLGSVALWIELRRNTGVSAHAG